jgi:hypothetical protein
MWLMSLVNLSKCTVESIKYLFNENIKRLIRCEVVRTISRHGENNASPSGRIIISGNSLRIKPGA